MSTFNETEPRSPTETEFTQVVHFLNKNLRSHAQWSIDTEYPTTLNSVNLHNMRIISENDQVVSHAVVKPLIIKSPHVIFKMGAIGSVVTAESARGKGFSTQIIQECLKLSAEQQCDAAILWTNLYDFYRKLGFELAGSEVSFVFEENFTSSENDLRFSSLNNVAPEALLRLYSQHTVSTVRSLEDIRKYLSIPNTKVHTAWSSDGQLSAYAIEGKGMDLTGYIHEWGGRTGAIISLLSYIRREKNAQITIICPIHAENLITQIKNIPGVIQNEGYLGMIKISHFDQLSAKIKRAFRAEGVNDFILEKQGNVFLFGVGQELFTLEKESAITQLLFGPVNYQEMGIFSQNALSKLSRLLPLKLWIWGWDSI